MSDICWLRLHLQDVCAFPHNIDFCAMGDFVEDASSEFSIPTLRVSSKQLTLTLEVLVLAPSLSPQKGSMNDFQEQVGFTLSSNGPQIVCGVKHQGPWSQWSSPAMPPGIAIVSTCTGDDSSNTLTVTAGQVVSKSHLEFLLGLRVK